jgi:serine/threonine protein kinase
MTPDNDRLIDLFVEWEERAEQGEDVPAELLCRDCPELVPALEESIRQARRFARLNEKLPGSDAGGSTLAEAEPVFRTGLEPVPGYRLVHRQGRGNFGEVWAAAALGSGSRARLVAVKFVHGSLDEDRPRILAEHELEGLARIKGVSHPHVLEIIGAEVSGTTLLVVTELADSSLEQHFLGLPVACTPLERCVHAAALLWGVAEALDHLQQHHGLMHLDVKPANLLLVGRRCKLADFGTVKRMRAGRAGTGEVLLAHRPGPDPDLSATQTRYRTCQEVRWEEGMRPEATLYTAAGAFTPYYASPEVFQGRASRSSDQYSLALTFCQLAVGRVPFAGKDEAQIAQRRDGRLDWGTLPAALRPALARALSPRPEDRFDSCLEFVRAVTDALEPEARRSFGGLDLFPDAAEDTPALPQSRPDEATELAGPRDPARRRSSGAGTARPKEAKPKGRAKKRRTAPPVRIGVAVLVAPAVAGYLVWRWAAWLVGKVVMPAAAHPSRGQRAEHRLVCALLLIPALVPAVVLYRCTERIAPPPEVRKDEAPPPPAPAKKGLVTNPFSTSSDNGNRR